jgi:hypothetical protein
VLRFGRPNNPTAPRTGPPAKPSGVQVVVSALSISIRNVSLVASEPSAAKLLLIDSQSTEHYADVVDLRNIAVKFWRLLAISTTSPLPCSSNSIS